jgi:hypothetical protein
VNDWEIIADDLRKAGWSLGCISAIDSQGRTIWMFDAHRDNGKRFVVRANEKLTAFVELESAVRACGELNRQAGEIFPKLPKCENKHFTSSNHICTRLLCARPKHAGGQSAAGRRLPRRQHRGRAKRPFGPHDWHLQYGSWFLVAAQHHDQQLQHSYRSRGAPCQHRRSKYG